MRNLIVFFLILTLFSCKRNAELKQVQILFKPSFLHQTMLTIDIKNKTIEQYTFQTTYYATEWVDSTEFLEKRIDTLIIHYQKTFPISDEILGEFLTELNAAPLDSTIQHYEPMLDGIVFRVSKINSLNDTISIGSNITRRKEQSELEYKILDAFFELAYKSINDYKAVCEIENIQDYFSYGLPIRKVNENPIEYRILGSIIGCRKDNQEFLKFLENLPKDKPVIFDLRNGSIAYCLNEMVEEFSQKKLLYFYGDSLPEIRINQYKTFETDWEDLQNKQKIKLFHTRGEALKAIDKDMMKKSPKAK